MKSDKPMIISKLDLLKAPAGHQHHWTGTGVHRDHRKSPKGGRRAANRSAIERASY